MHIRSFLIASVAALTFATPSFATINLCQSRIVDVPDIVHPGEIVPIFGNVEYVIQTGTSNPPGKAVPFDHTCGLPSNFGCVSPSLSEQVAAPIFGTETRYEQVGEEQLPDVIEVTPDQPQFRIGVTIKGKWIGTNWKNGSCPN